MAHPDPFLRSMALWVLRDYTGSLSTLLQTNVGTMHPQYSDEDKPDSASMLIYPQCPLGNYRAARIIIFYYL